MRHGGQVVMVGGSAIVAWLAKTAGSGNDFKNARPFVFRYSWRFLHTNNTETPMTQAPTTNSCSPPAPSACRRTATGSAPTPPWRAADGEVRVKILYLSLDPAMRGWMNEGKSYVRPVAIGEVMRAGGVGVVEESKSPRFARPATT
jgi:hypothetical protein